MSGYDWNAGMSNRAVMAYDNGLVPASKIKGVPAELVRKYCAPSEWHHTSSKFNCTDFFDPDEVRSVFGLDGDEGDESAVAALAAWKEAKKAGAEFFEKSTVEWCEFTRRSGRRWRRASWDVEEIEHSNVTVRVRGAMIDVLTARGNIITKKLTAKSVVFRPGKPISERAWRGRCKKAGVSV